MLHQRKVFLFVLAGLIVLGTEKMYALPVFWSFGGEKIIKIADLPDTTEYVIDGSLVDIGIIYKRVTIFFISIINYDKRWCVYSNSDDSYIPMDKAELDELAIEAGVTLPEKMKLPFSDVWLRWLIFGPILLLIIYGLIPSRKKDTDIEVEKTESPPDV